MHYLIVGVGQGEEILCTGTRAELEALAKKLRKGTFFRWVRVDKTPPHGVKSPKKGVPKKDGVEVTPKRS